MSSFQKNKPLQAKSEPVDGNQSDPDELGLSLPVETAGNAGQEDSASGEIADPDGSKNFQDSKESEEFDDADSVEVNLTEYTQEELKIVQTNGSGLDEKYKNEIEQKLSKSQEEMDKKIGRVQTMLETVLAKLESANSLHAEGGAAASSINNADTVNGNTPNRLLAENVVKQKDSQSVDTDQSGKSNADDVSSISSASTEMSFADMGFGELKDIADMYLNGNMRGIIPNVQNYFGDHGSRLTILRAFCIVSQAADSGKLGKDVLNDLRDIYRCLPQVTNKKNLTLGLNDPLVQESIANDSPTIFSEEKILRYFDLKDGSNRLDKATHWDMDCQLALETLLKEQYSGTSIPAKVLAHGSFDMLLLTNAISAWDGGTAAIGPNADDDNLGLALSVVEGKPTHNPDGIPWTRNPMLNQELSFREKRIPYRIRPNPMSKELYDALWVLAALPTASIHNKESQMSTAAFAAAHKWDAAQKLIVEVVKILLKSIVNNPRSHPDRAVAANLALTNDLCTQGSIYISGSCHVVPTPPSRYAESQGLKMTIGTTALTILKDVMNKGSAIGGLKEVNAMLTRVFDREGGILNHFIESKQLWIMAKHACKPIPGTGAENPATAESVAIWASTQQFLAFGQSGSKPMSQSNKKFLKKFSSLYNAGKLNTWSKVMDVAKQAENEGNFARIAVSKKPPPSYAYAAKNAIGSDGKNNESSRPPKPPVLPPGGGKGRDRRLEFNIPPNEMVSLENYALCVKDFIKTLESNPDCNIEDWLEEIDISQLEKAEAAYRIKLDPTKKKLPFIPSQFAGHSKLALKVMKDALKPDSPRYNPTIANASGRPRSKLKFRAQPDNTQGVAALNAHKSAHKARQASYAAKQAADAAEKLAENASIAAVAAGASFSSGGGTQAGLKGGTHHSTSTGASVGSGGGARHPSAAGASVGSGGGNQHSFAAGATVGSGGGAHPSKNLKTGSGAAAASGGWDEEDDN